MNEQSFAAPWIDKVLATPTWKYFVHDQEVTRDEYIAAWEQMFGPLTEQELQNIPPPQTEKPSQPTL